MSDVVLSVYILAGAALIAGAILLLTRRAVKRREEALAFFCEKNGYRLTTEKKPTERTIVVEGDGWRLVSSMRALQNAAQAGSSDWQRETRWDCADKNPLRRSFALQVSAGSTDPDALPSVLRDIAISAIRLRLDGSAASFSSVRTAFHENGRSGIIFETEPNAAADALESLRVPLAAWRGGLPLYLSCSPEGVQITLPDCAAKTAEEIESLIAIGFALQ